MVDSTSVLDCSVMNYYALISHLGGDIVAFETASVSLAVMRHDKKCKKIIIIKGFT